MINDPFDRHIPISDRYPIFLIVIGAITHSPPSAPLILGILIAGFAVEALIDWFFNWPWVRRDN